MVTIFTPLPVVSHCKSMNILLFYIHDFTPMLGVTRVSFLNIYLFIEKGINATVPMWSQKTVLGSRDHHVDP